jgi:magnesium-transporting ATPase (P-type)
LGTDLVPAISLAYEKAESDIMNLPPRNPKTQKLVTGKLLVRAYFVLGVIESSAGFLGYFVAFLSQGFRPQDLWQLRVKWEDTKNNKLLDSYGRPHVIITIQMICINFK